MNSINSDQTALMFAYAKNRFSHDVAVIGIIIIGGRNSDAPGGGEAAS